MEHTTHNLVRWGDLVSPRSMYRFALGDAVASLPTLLAMAGFFIVGLVCLLVVRYLYYWMFLYSNMTKKFVREIGPNGCEQYRAVPRHPFGSVKHLLIETVFFLGLVVLGYWAFAIGGFNVWQSAIGASAIGIIFTYVFGPGLQQVGAAYFFFFMDYMEEDQYWEVSGSAGRIGGKVISITPFYVDFEQWDLEHETVIVRVPMLRVMSDVWNRSFKLEKKALEIEATSCNPGGLAERGKKKGCRWWCCGRRTHTQGHRVKRKEHFV